MDGMNDPMNPMGQVQISNPMNPMGTASQQAYGLSSLGRGDDSMLVHMTPNEVQGLQTLAKAHGGSLTVNPDTGLPEAGFLSSILPTIIGIAAAPFTAGTSLAFLANPFISGGLAGLGAMIASGGDLKEGLKWGLGVGGGTALGSGLQNMVNPVTKIGEVALTPGGAGVNLAGAAPTTGTYAANVGQNLSSMAQGAGQVLKGNLAGFDPGLGKLIGTGGRGLAGTAGLGLASMAMQPPEPLEIQKSQEDKDYGPGGKYEYKGPYTFPDYGPVTYATPEEMEQGVEHSYFGDKYNLPPQYVEASKEGGVIGMAEGGNVGEQSYFGNNYYNSGSGNLNGMPSGMPSWMANNPAWTSFFANIQRSPFLKNIFPTTTQDTTPYANSGNAGYSDMGEQMFFSPSYFSAGQGTATPATTTTPQATGGRSGNGVAYPQAPGTFTTPTSGVGGMFAKAGAAFNAANMGPAKPKGMAAGGIADLPGAPVGNGTVEGMLAGPGDGMSDSIPARIDGKQEARLATGEFVVPADVVSHLGNGASEPGAKVLYAMMDRVRKARTGNPEQGKEINPDKFIPA